MPAANTKIQEVLARRQKAAKAATTTGKVPTNRPAQVEPAQARPKIQSLGRKVAAPVVEAEDDDDGDSPIRVTKNRPAFRKVSVTTPELTQKLDRSAARAAAVQGTKPSRTMTLPQAPQGGALAVRGPDLTRQITQQDTVIPRLKICQAMSKVNTDKQVSMGEWYRSPQNKSLGETILVAIADMFKSRSYFEQGQGVLCRSFDLIKGEGDPGIACEGSQEEMDDPTISADERGCPLRLWTEEGDRRIPPPCGIAYNYPLLILDPEDPSEGPTKTAMLSLRSTATKIAKQINTIILDNEGDWSTVVLELGVTSTSNTKGTFYVPTVEFHSMNAGLSLRKARKFATQMNANAVRSTLEADSDRD